MNHVETETPSSTESSLHCIDRHASCFKLHGTANCTQRFGGTEHMTQWEILYIHNEHRNIVNMTDSAVS
jgi:hypothetical protein